MGLRTRWMIARMLPLMAIATISIAACATAAPSPSPTLAPTPIPTPAPLARGSFTAPLTPDSPTALDIEATGGGTDASGTLKVTDTSGTFSVDLQCARTADTGLIMIGGDVTESTHLQAPAGIRVAIVLQPGDPVKSILWIEDAAAADCAAFLEEIPTDDVADFLQPIDGDLELAS